jgi:hypothetical protein
MINMAKLVWSFDLSPGSKNVDDDIETAYGDGFLTCPKEFPILFTHRSKEHDEVIKKEFEAAKLVFAKYED